MIGSLGAGSEFGMTRAAAMLALASLVVGLLPAELRAQVAATSAAMEMRHFWHVFLAYAAAWILLLAWLVSIVRRLRRVEEKLD